MEGNDPKAKALNARRQNAGPEALEETVRGGLLAQIVGIAPRIKGPIQLAGFLFSVLAAVLINRMNPANIQALGMVGAIGVALVAIPLLFHPAMLKTFPPFHRVVLVLATLAILLGSFVALAVVTKNAIDDVEPDGTRFDSSLDPAMVRVVSRDVAGPGTARIEIIWRLFPITKRADQSATVFTGVAALHDEDAVGRPGIGEPAPKSCAEVKSCVGSHVFKEYGERPVVVRGDSDGTFLTTVVDVKRVPKNVRVWWEFYQLEGKDGARCGEDYRRVNKVAEGVPPLAMFDRSGQRVGNGCYLSFGQRTVSGL